MVIYWIYSEVLIVNLRGCSDVCHVCKCQFAIGNRELTFHHQITNTHRVQYSPSLFIPT